MIHKVIGSSGDPSIIGSHMEQSACTACIAFRWNVNPVDEPEDESEYISTDGRTPVEHYMRGGYECIDIMRAVSTPEGFQAHCHLTAFKYLYRLGEKDDPIREVKKARDYLMWLQQSLESEAAKKPPTPTSKSPSSVNGCFCVGDLHPQCKEVPETD